MAETNLIKNLKLLLNEGKIHAVTQVSDPQKLVSVGLEPLTIRELEGDVKPRVKYQSMVKNIYGPNIETTTYGANSPVMINIEEIETVFENIQKEIKENPDVKEEEKKEVSRVVRELEVEITQDKDPRNAAKKILEEING